MLVIRTSLDKGNPKVKAAIRDTKHDKEKTFDKIVAMMLENCYNKIEEKDIAKVLNPDNFGLWEESFAELIEFNKNVFQIIGPDVKYTQKEKIILEDIDKVMTNPGIELPVEEESSRDIFTEKLGKYKYMAMGMMIGFTISFVYTLFYTKLIKRN